MNLKLDINDTRFGPILPLVQDPNITDINWNGETLWVDDLEKGRYEVVDLKLSKEFIESFSNSVANSVSASFNKYCPLLEAETEDLRISIIHEAVAPTGRTISIRSTPATVRMSATGDLAKFLELSVMAGASIIVGGLPGTGKTETIKYLTKFIPGNERVITIEDNLELRYRDINPGRDSVSLRVQEGFTYVDALKAVLRQNTQRVILSEVRSVEVKHLFESMSTGTKGITSIHANHGENIPGRIYNMFPPGENEEKIINMVYQYIDIGIIIDKKAKPNLPITRTIQEIVLFERIENENKMVELYRDGVFLTSELTKTLQSKLDYIEVENPLKKGGKTHDKQSG